MPARLASGTLKTEKLKLPIKERTGAAGGVGAFVFPPPPLLPPPHPGRTTMRASAAMAPRPSAQFRRDIDASSGAGTEPAHGRVRVKGPDFGSREQRPV